MENILEIKDLHTYFYTQGSVIKAVEGVSFSVKKGEVLGLVGESACGKSVTASSIMRLIAPPGEIVKGQIFFEGEDLLKLSSPCMRRLRGNKISMIFQEPQAALNPLYTIGFQIEEMIKIHKNISKSQIRPLALELLRKVGVNPPEIRIKDYPHNLSGGQAQRVMIAMAISCNPALLIADEPTTALDVTIQAQIMELFTQLRQDFNFTLIFITHNLALCSQVATCVAIMYGGRIVELAPKDEIFTNPLHPYTQALFSSIPRGMPRGNSGKSEFKVIQGVVPDASSKPKGCYFHPRCCLRKEVCTEGYPEFIEARPEHWVSCFMAG
ncbi:MAG: ABC transporter ATP-binding protein [Candidatus Omnitrophica bacterium]|nr:ABC transporter ATP-binding protein [Candidatus Omnitrophota bacterium]